MNLGTFRSFLPFNSLTSTPAYKPKAQKKRSVPYLLRILFLLLFRSKRRRRTESLCRRRSSPRTGSTRSCKPPKQRLHPRFLLLFFLREIIRERAVDFRGFLGYCVGSVRCCVFDCFKGCSGIDVRGRRGCSWRRGFCGFFDDG